MEKTKTGSDIRLILAEGSNELGGKIRTVTENDFVMVVLERIQLLLEKQMSYLSYKSLVWKVKSFSQCQRHFPFPLADGELKPIPLDSVFGIPTSLESLAKSTLISAEGKVEKLKDYYTKMKHSQKKIQLVNFLNIFLEKNWWKKKLLLFFSRLYLVNLSNLTINSTLP